MTISKVLQFIAAHFLKYRKYRVKIMDGGTASVAGILDRGSKTPYLIIGDYVLYLTKDR